MGIVVQCREGVRGSTNTRNVCITLSISDGIALRFALASGCTDGVRFNQGLKRTLLLHASQSRGPIGFFVLPKAFMRKELVFSLTP